MNDEDLDKLLTLAKKTGKLYVASDVFAQVDDMLTPWGITVKELKYLNNGSMVAIDEEQVEKTIKACCNEVILEGM